MEEKSGSESITERIRRFLGVIGLLDPVWDPPAKAKGTGEPQLNVADPMIVFWCIRFRPAWVVHPEGNRYYYWLCILALAILYNILAIPLRVVFHELDEDSYVTSFMITDYLADFLYLVDIYVGMFSSHLSDDGLYLMEPRKLIREWFSYTSGRLDIICLIPLDLLFIYTGTDAPYAALRFNRWLKYGRFTTFLKKAEGRSSKADIFRLVGVLFQFLLLIHIMACLYYFASEAVGIDSSEYVYPGEASWRIKDGNGSNINDTLFQKYTWSFYWSMHTLTMIGITVQPKLPWELLFQTCCMLISVMLYSQILGNVSRTVLNAGLHARDFRTRMDHVMQYLDLRGVSKELRRKVVDYFEYQWMNHQVVDEKHVVECLPHKIKQDMAMKVHFNTLRHVRIFQGVEPGLLADLVLKLKLQIFTAGEYICRKGDIGRELYIVKKGCLEVVSDDGQFVFAVLGEGSVFGEISLLNMAGMKSGNRRTANVRSIGYADLFCLSKDDLWEALAEYPEGKNRMLEVGRQILLKDNLLNVEVADAEARRHNVFLDQLERVESGVDGLHTKFGRLCAERAAIVAKMQRRVARIEKKLTLQGNVSVAGDKTANVKLKNTVKIVET